MSDQLKEFFAVTLTSVYHVKDDDGAGEPEAKKIAMIGGSKIGLGNGLRGGTMIAIANSLVRYMPEGGSSFNSTYERRLECVNASFWGSQTSPLVALFFTKEEAMDCFHSGSLVAADPRWKQQSLAVINAVGDDHSKFTVCRFKQSAFPLLFS